MKPYKIALLTGTHQHRWPNDGSGVCEKCHKEHSPHKYLSGNPGICTVCGAEGKCPHTGGLTSINSARHQCRVCYASLPHSLVKVTEEKQCVKCSDCGRVITSHQFSGGVCSVCDYVCQHQWNTSAEQHSCAKCDVKASHAWQNNAEKTLCRTCTVCGYQQSNHTFNGGVCVRCNYACDHPTFTPVNGSTHKCSVCNGYTANHTWTSISGNPTHCRRCNACGYQAVHQGITRLGDACTVCGAVHSAHVWSLGSCMVCGTDCTHSSINSSGQCTVCGMMLRKPGTPYSFFGGTAYDGSYGDAEVHYTDDTHADAYTVYKGYKWSSASGAWVANGYYFFSFAVTHYKTTFGGSYAYKLTGGVFSTSSTTVNVSPALLSANGVYKLKLAQYETDGTLKASSMSGYTSADCNFNTASAPAWPSWTA